MKRRPKIDRSQPGADERLYGEENKTANNTKIAQKS
jgi:hypothetical protein